MRRSEREEQKENQWKIFGEWRKYKSNQVLCNCISLPYVLTAKNSNVTAKKDTTFYSL